MKPLVCTSSLVIGALPAADEWELKAPLIWQLRGGNQLIVPAGFITDLASIPRIFQNLLSVTGRSRRAAVAHDWLYCSHLIPRKEADQFLKEALICEGVSGFTAWLYWAGVHIGGSSPWNENKDGITPEDFTTAEAYYKWQQYQSRRQ